MLLQEIEKTIIILYHHMKKAKVAKSKSAPVKTAKAKPAKEAKKKPSKPSKPSKAVKATPSTKEVKVTKDSGSNGSDDKQHIIENFAQGKGDTGSPEVQVALLSFKINRLTGHLEVNKKDNHSRRGLLKVIAKRRRILNYLQELDKDRYKGLIERLGLKK